MLNFATVNTITTAQAAEIIGLDEHVIREYCRRKLIPATKFGRQWAILEKDAIAYKENREKNSKPKSEDPN